MPKLLGLTLQWWVAMELGKHHTAASQDNFQKTPSHPFPLALTLSQLPATLRWICFSYLNSQKRVPEGAVVKEGTDSFVLSQIWPAGLKQLRMHVIHSPGQTDTFQVSALNVGCVQSKTLFIYLPQLPRDFRSLDWIFFLFWFHWKKKICPTWSQRSYFYNKRL